MPEHVAQQLSGLDRMQVVLKEYMKLQNQQMKADSAFKTRLIAIAEDVGIVGLCVLLLQTMARKVPTSSFEMALTAFLNITYVGITTLVALRTILKGVLWSRIREHQDVSRHRSGTLAIDIPLWLVDPRNTVTSHGFVVIVTAMCMLIAAGPLQLATWSRLALSYAAAAFVFSALRLRQEARKPYLMQHFVAGTSPHVVQRVGWFVVVSLAATMIVWIGAQFGLVGQP